MMASVSARSSDHDRRLEGSPDESLVSLACGYVPLSDGGALIHQLGHSHVGFGDSGRRGPAAHSFRDHSTNSLARSRKTFIDPGAAPRTLGFLALSFHDSFHACLLAQEGGSLGARVSGTAKEQLRG